VNSTADRPVPAAALRGNVLVSAGAGTGKTSTLVQQCMTLLAEGGSLENILMVTFTEAAAVEMRGRIRIALQQKVRELETAPAGPGPALEHFQKQLLLLDTALISTLHSFCLQLVREHFYELGIDPDVTVLDEQQTQPLIQQTLDAILERHYAGESDADRAVQALVRGQGRGSDDRIRALILKLHRYSQARDNPGQWLDQQWSLFNQAEPVRWREWFVEAFSGWRQSWLAELKPFAGTPAVELSLKALQPISDPPTLSTIGQALRSVGVSDDDKINWPRGSKTNVRSRIEDFFDEARFLASLAPSDQADPLAEDWERVRQDLLALTGVAREFAAEFSRAKRDAGGVDFADLEQFALRVLHEPPTTTRWQQQLDHIFVDEYQDINAAQDAILRALSRTGAAANRFLVGDVKQSIYRFRLADPTIFRGYETEWGNGGSNSRRLPLADNFRSREGILDFVNQLFRVLMRENVGGVAYEDLKFGNTPERAALAREQSREPCVEFHLIGGSEEPGDGGEGDVEETAPALEMADLPATELEARLVALRLRELKAQRHEIRDRDSNRLRPVQWSDMAVLLRSPANRVEAFAKEFARLGIPLEAERGGFFDSLEISDLVSLLKVLDNPLQDIPLLAVLRSALAGLTPAELAEIRAAELPERRSKYFWLAAQRFHRENRDGGSAWRKLDTFLEQLQHWRELVRQASLSACLEAALNETHYESVLRANLRGEQQVANVRRLLELAREYDPYQRQGLFRFLRYIAAQEEMAAPIEPAAAVHRDAVQLMSIHRSKGLEFPVVVLAGLGWRFNERDLRESILLDDRYGLCPRILAPGSDESYPSLPWWLARRRQKRELLGEELRLWYVAMTRARDTLVLTGTSTGKGGGKWKDEDDQTENSLSDRELLAAHSYLDWLKLWLSRAARPDDWKNDREGQMQLLRWTIYAGNDPQLALAESHSVDQEVAPKPAPAVDESALTELRARVNWSYPFPAATRLKAKTSVTELRRLAEQDEDAVPARYARRNVFQTSAQRSRGLDAAEVGTAHHRFLQRVTLSETGSVEALCGEAERMERDGWLTEAEKSVLDFEGLAQFWSSDFGRQIVLNAGSVRRELPFSTRLVPEELEMITGETSAAATNASAGDFVVVQGVVDLAVILPKEIWLVDFKTDEIRKDELSQKTDLYRPQLRAYALALNRVYGLPVTECRLHFLSLRTTVSIHL
jgi:ATP-dependent helicase/nuclease subunit A